jgi:hypothetical protein
MEVSGQLHAPAALSQAKEPPYPLNRKLRGPQSGGVDVVEKRKSPNPPPPGIVPPNPDCPARNQSLYRLNSSGSSNKSMVQGTGTQLMKMFL